MKLVLQISGSGKDGFPARAVIQIYICPEDPGPRNRGVTAALCIPIFDAAVAVNSMGSSGANFIVN